MTPPSGPDGKTRRLIDRQEEGEVGTEAIHLGGGQMRTFPPRKGWSGWLPKSCKFIACSRHTVHISRLYFQCGFTPLFVCFCLTFKMITLRMGCHSVSHIMQNRGRYTHRENLPCKMKSWMNRELVNFSEFFFPSASPAPKVKHFSFYLSSSQMCLFVKSRLPNE